MGSSPIVTITFMYVYFTLIFCRFTHFCLNDFTPRHLISDVHEWINEIPTGFMYYLVKPQPRERAWNTFFKNALYGCQWPLSTVSYLLSTLN